MTSLPVTEVRWRMDAVVGPRRWNTWPTRLRPPFEGTIHGDQFTVRRAIGHRNSFRPQIHGAIRAIPHGTAVDLTLRLHPSVSAFMAVWLTAVGVGCVVEVVATIRAGSVEAFVAIPFVMFAAGVLMCLVGYRVEATIAKRRLAELLAATPMPTT